MAASKSARREFGSRAEEGSRNFIAEVIIVVRSRLYRVDYV